ncbi:hypothetical protein MFMK1_002410 [Metallumcola ferriviriculae]|uniref:Spore coat protein n=1 Tax=Metallumcola ferriviriculae TaxID=3039180 RepID=A0AAU0UQK1_9FIRM|nr:hypothetical protein MFMK1_002410 [Desulfitibacteraceae bacterium MK1]
MANLNQMELQSLRHLVSDEQLCATKCQTYAQQSQDPQLQKYFNTAAKQAQQNVQTLQQFLQ